MGTKLIEMGDIKFKELASEIKRLNDSGLVEQKINAVGKTKEELVDLFVKAVQAIPDDADGNWAGPEETAKYYMTLLAPAEDKKAAGNKSVGKKVKGVKKEKDVAGSKAAGINEYGFREGSASARASVLIMSGEHNIESASKVIEKEFDKTSDIAKGRIKIIARVLKMNGLEIKLKKE